MPWLMSRLASEGWLRFVLLASIVCRAHSGAVNIYWYRHQHCTASNLINYVGNENTDSTANCHNILSSTSAGVQQHRGYKLVCANAIGMGGSGLAFAATDLVLQVDQGAGGCGSAGGPINTVVASAHGDCWQVPGQTDFMVWVKWEYPTAVSVCGETVPLSAQPGGTVSGDPVTWYGDRREEFILPIGALTPIIRSKDMQVLASARHGMEEDQWIDRIVVTDSPGNLVLDAAIKRNLTRFNRAALLPNAFETMDIKMEWWRPGLVDIMPPGDAQFNHWSGISLGFGRVRHYGQAKLGAEPRREAVIVQSNSLKILVISSSAREWFGEWSALGAEMSHLDIEVMEMGDEAQLQGLLPELWGLQPMSERTRSLRKEPEHDAETNISFVNMTASSDRPRPRPFVDGFSGPRSIKKAISEGNAKSSAAEIEI